MYLFVVVDYFVMCVVILTLPHTACMLQRVRCVKMTPYDQYYVKVSVRCVKMTPYDQYYVKVS